MSLVMNLYYKGKNGSARAFAEEMEKNGTAELIRKEEGNEMYSYFISLDDPETVLLIDAWKNQEALDKHHASPMMKTIIQLREKYNLHMSAKRFISDDENSKDDAFIRK